jgi:chemotaxis protein methyltransferase CheR
VIRLEDAQYRRFRELIAARTGLDFPEQRRRDLEAGLHRALAGSPRQDLDSYYRLLLDESRGQDAFDHLVAYLTVGETYFFRNSAQFDALRQQILPRLIARARASGRLRIWSAGCAAGEEPYSLAMVLREVIPDVDAWTVLILGTDINRALLGRAEQARYGPWSFRGCPPARRARYFIDRGTEFELRPEIRRMVTFARHNLVADPYPPPAAGPEPMDLILCRNVTIYFDAAATRRVVDRFYDCLVDGGWLIVGHAEPSLETYRRFRTCNFPDTIAYQRAGPERPPRGPRAHPVLHERPGGPDPAEAGAPRGDLALPPARAAREGPRAGPYGAEDTYRRAREHADRGLLQDALRLAEEALAADPLHTRAHYLVGLVYQEQGQWEPALEAFRRATFLDPTFIMAYVALAGVARRVGDLEQARRALHAVDGLLRGKSTGDLVPESEGLTVGALRDALALQVQAR